MKPGGHFDTTHFLVSSSIDRDRYKTIENRGWMDHAWSPGNGYIQSAIVRKEMRNGRWTEMG